MKLFYSPTSPFARKVRVLVHEKGCAEQVEYILAATMEDPAALHAANPLGRVPALITPEGTPVIESDVICAYLDEVLPGQKLIPSEGPAHWQSLYRQSLGDGIMEAAIRLIYEKNRPESERSAMWMARWKRAIDRSVIALEADMGVAQSGLDIGGIAVACALGYIDFRHPDIEWRANAPRLSGWYATMSARPSFVESNPA
ncbi:MAG: glutathione S-transferase [Parvibaculaceae bacterium]|nr:glutathione S-transferase [Parvibaculaceae bacterium]